MPDGKHGPAGIYEHKLKQVMGRLGVEDYDFNWDRWNAWVEFRYGGELYRLEHGVEKAKEKGVELRYGSDAFAEMVLTLEDLVRIVERGIYELETWLAGMKHRPSGREGAEGSPVPRGAGAAGEKGPGGGAGAVSRGL
jgi:hypothetical protein